MNKDRKRSLRSALASLLIHGLILLLLMSLTLSASDRETDDGIPVLLADGLEGMSAGLGPDAEGGSSGANTPANDNANAPASRHTDEGQKARRSVSQPQTTNPGLTTTPDAQAQERQQKAKDAAASRIAGKFGTGTGTGTGTGAGTGGSGGNGGVGAGANVGNRSALTLVKPEYSDKEELRATIVVSIIVDAEGKVISAIIKTSTTSSASLRASATDAALRSRFTPGTSNDTGTITYHFQRTTN